MVAIKEATFFSVAPGTCHSSCGQGKLRGNKKKSGWPKLARAWREVAAGSGFPVCLPEGGWCLLRCLCFTCGPRKQRWKYLWAGVGLVSGIGCQALALVGRAGERGVGVCGTGFRCKQRERGDVRHGL